MIEDRIEVNIAGGLDIPLPPMASVRQKFTTTRVDDIAAAVAREFERPEIRASIRRGARMAVGCGSRGVANYAHIARAVIGEIKALGGDPFVFPAMGSHGAATAEGQRHVLEGAGITEDFVGAGRDETPAVPVRRQSTTDRRLGYSSHHEDSHWKSCRG